LEYVTGGHSSLWIGKLRQIRQNTTVDEIRDRTMKGRDQIIGSALTTGIRHEPIHGPILSESDFGLKDKSFVPPMWLPR
jgi:hypothetical protein